MSEAVAGNSPDRSKRIYVLWAAGFAFLALLALFCWLFLRPYMEVRAAVRRVTENQQSDYGDEVKALGGPEQAAAKCALYLRFPKKLPVWDKDNAFRILLVCGQPAVPWLVSLLRSKDAYVRWRAANVLGDLRDLRAVEPLIAALKDPEADVRWSAAHALGKLKDPRAVEPLRPLLTDPDNDVRRAAEAALVRIEAPVLIVE